VRIGLPGRGDHGRRGGVGDGEHDDHLGRRAAGGDVHSDVAGLDHVVHGLGELADLVVSVHDPVGAERVGQAFGGGGSGHGSSSSGGVVPGGGRRDLAAPEGGGDVVPPSEFRQRSETGGVIPGNRPGGVPG